MVATCGGRFWSSGSCSRCVFHAAATEQAPGLHKETEDAQCREKAGPSHGLAAPRDLVRLGWVDGRVHDRASAFPRARNVRLSTCALFPFGRVRKLPPLPTWIERSLHDIQPGWRCQYDGDRQGAAQPSEREYALE